MKATRKPGRPERPLDPAAGPEKALAFALRKLREESGSPSYRKMAKAAHYSSSTLARAASGDVLPSLDLTLAYVRACGGDAEEWEQRWTGVVARLDHAGVPDGTGVRSPGRTR